MAVQRGAHPSADILKAFGLGKLDDSSSEVVLDHLDQCEYCRKQVESLSGDDFVNRLRQARGRSFTPAPAKELSDVSRAAKRPVGQTPVPNLPPELAANSQYEILRELGRGGMGIVYLAKNKLMDRLEVLKVVNKTLLDHPGAVERFLREIRSAAKLSHANVVTAYSAVQQGELLAFAMEYVEGEDLASLVKSQGLLPIAHACFYTQQAAWGLQHAHDKGMVHRDIKPQNLILTREGKRHIVKVLDFGLAKATREKKDNTGLTGEGKMLGTPDYIAPEQQLDAAKADIRADIYSLGCTLYYLLAGHPPFSGTSLTAVLLAHQMNEANPLNLERPEVPEELAAVVRKMMAKSPDKRYQTPLDVVQALSPFVKQGGTSKASPELSSSMAPPRPVVQIATPVIPSATPVAEVPKQQPKPAAVWESLTDNSAESIIPRKSSSVRRHQAATVREWRSPNKWLVGGGLCMGVLLLALGVFMIKTPEGIIVLENLTDDAEVLVDGEKVTVSWDRGGKKAEVRVKPSTHRVEVKKDDLTIYGEKVEIEDGKRRVLTVKLIHEHPLQKEDKIVEPPPPAPPVEQTDKVLPGKKTQNEKTAQPKTVEPLRTKDLLQMGSVWRGVGEYKVRGLPEQPQGKWNCVIRITRRTEDQFKADYEFEDGSKFASVIEGTVGESVGTTGKRKISWKHVQDIKSDANLRFPTEVGGTMEGAALDVRFSHRDRNNGLVVGSGVVTFRIDEKGRPAEKPNKDSFAQLFNGKDLTGWKVSAGGTGNWKVVSGVIVSSGPLSHLYTERNDFDNFHLRVEAMINDGGNSGVFFRAQPAPQFPLGYEAQIDSTGLDRIKTGSLSGIVNVTDQLHKPNEWFTQEVIAQGDHIVIKVNDKTVVDKHDSRYKKGCFALQQHDSASVVKFRKIEIKGLQALPSFARIPENLPPAAKEAAKDCEKAYANARAKLLSDFDMALERLEKMKGSADQRMKLIESVKEEKKRFENKGLTPWSQPMRTAAIAYLRERKNASNHLTNSTANLRQLYRNSEGSDKEVQKILANIESLLTPQAIGTWSCEGLNFERSFVWTLYSNMKVNNPKGDSTWSLEQSGMTLRIHVPEGVFIDTCDIEVSGQSFKAKNQFSGTYAGTLVR